MSDLQFLPSFVALTQTLADLGEAEADEAVLLELEEFELEVQDMCQALHAQCLDHLYDEELRDLISPVLENYQFTYAAIDALREALEEWRPWKEAWDEAQDSLRLALEGYPALAAWHERQPKLSPSPYIHELVRVGRACLQEKLPWESFAFRLDQYREVLQEFCHRYQQEELQRGAWGLQAEQRLSLEFQVDQMLTCMDELTEADGAAFGSALENLLERSGQLLEWQISVQLDFEQPLRGELACPRCGNGNPKISRVCERCGVRLPQNLSQSVPSSTVDLHSEKIATGLPMLVADLVDSLDRFLGRQLEASVLLEQLAEAQRKAELVGQQLGRFPEAPEDAPEEPGRLLESGWQVMTETQADYQRLLEELQEAVESGHISSVFRLREQLVDCVTAYQKLEEISQKLNQQLHGSH